MIYAVEQEPPANWITRINQRVSEKDFKDHASSYAYSITSFITKLLGYILFRLDFLFLKAIWVLDRL